MTLEVVIESQVAPITKYFRLFIFGKNGIEFPIKSGWCSVPTRGMSVREGCDQRCQEHNDAGGMMTKGVNNMVKSSKLGAVTQGR